MKQQLLALTIACGAILPMPVTAQGTLCSARAEMVERLQSRFGEIRTGAGLASDNGVVEVFTSAETGTWTIIVTTPGGRSCMVAAGDNWQTGPTIASGSGQPV